MVSSIRDYTKQLADARTKYSEASTQLRDNYDSDVKNLKERNETRENRLRKNFLRQKDEFEETTQNHLKDYDHKIKKEISRRTKKFNEDLKSENADHTRERRRMISNFKSKLGDISNSFEVSSAEKDKLHALNKKNFEERYDKGVNQREAEFNSKLEQFQRDNNAAFTDFRDAQRDERRNLISNFSKERKKLVQDANLAKNELGNIHQEEKEILREAHRHSIESMKNNAENSRQSLVANTRADEKRTRETYEELSDAITEKNHETIQEMNREHKNDKRAMERAFANDRIQLERRTNAILNEGRGDEVEKSKQEINEKWEGRLKNIKTSMDEMNYNNQIMNRKIAQDQQDILKLNEVENRKEQDDLRADLRKFREKEIGSYKRKFEALNTENTRQVKELTRDLENHQIKARRNLTTKLVGVKKENNEVLKKIDEANINNLNELKTELLAEQTKFIEKTRNEAYREREELKDDMNFRFAKREEAYEQRIDSKVKEKENIVKNYENKIATIKKKAAKEIEQLKVIENEKRVEQRIAMDREVRQRNAMHKADIAKIRKDMYLKLDKAKTNSDIYIDKLVERYENQLNRERKEFNTEIQKRTALMNSEYQKLAAKAKMDVGRITEQYEGKIEELQNANKVANEAAARANRRG